MKVLVACEFSGVVSQAFRDRGHEAISCDLLENTMTGSQFHHQGDVRDILYKDWDLMVAHPPCTYLCNSGVRWLYRRKELIWHGDPTEEPLECLEDARRVKERWASLAMASEFFKELWNAPIDKICVENPIPHKYADLPSYTQVVQPWMFGDPFEKPTCLWLKGLEPLVPTEVVKPEPRVVFSSGRTMASWYNMSPSEDRGMKRGVTFSGIAKAMAEQWG